MVEWKKGMVGIRNGRLVNVLEPNPDDIRIEANLQAVIFQKFGLGVTAPPDVHTADQVMLATEISDYVGADPVYWGVTATPLSKRLRMPMKPLDAMNAFLDMFNELTEGR